MDRWIQSCTDISCDTTGSKKNQPLVDVQEFNFNAHHLQDTINVNYDAPDKYGYLGIKDLQLYGEQTGFHMFVISWKDYAQWRENNVWESNPEFFLKMKEDLGENILWDISNAGVDEVVIPPPGLGGYIPLFPQDLKSCGPDGNPFIVELVGNSESNFYDNKGKINPKCSNERYRTLNFNIVLSIPSVYWNADIDCDNLVNRKRIQVGR